MNCAYVLAIVFAVILCIQAQLIPKPTISLPGVAPYLLSSNEAIAAAVENAVEKTQYWYNRNFDESIRWSNVTAPINALKRAAAIANVKNVFCSTVDGFKSWIAYSPEGTAPTILATPADTAALYEFMAGGFYRRFSSHVVTNVEIQVYGIDRNPLTKVLAYANLTASIQQTVIQATLKPLPAPQELMTINFGRYHNTYLIKDSGEICMQQFEASTFINFPWQGAPLGPLNLATGSY